MKTIKDSLIFSKARTDFFKREVKSVWDKLYKRNIWYTVTQAGSEEKNIEVAKHEMNLYLFPDKDKVIKLRNNKNFGKRPIPENFYEHYPVPYYLGDLKKCVALDYGCGSLIRFTSELSKYFKYVYGIDSSPEAIKYGQFKLQKYKNLPKNSFGHNVELIETDGVSLKEIKSNTIDFVFSTLVFQHIGDLAVQYNLISEIYRILKRGGILRASFWTEQKPISHKDVYHGNGWNVEGYRKVFTEIGFDVKTMVHSFPILWITSLKGAYK